MEIGLYTFGDLVPHPTTGHRPSAMQRINEIMAAARLAEEVGLDAFGLGEHHRLDFAISTPAVVLSAIAAQTKRIRLTSAATVLAASDPVRVFEDFATLDLVSQGRAEIMAGRGAFIEPFPLFGYDLDSYDELFVENYSLLRKLGLAERITWRGEFRPELHNIDIAPRPCQNELPVWIAVGGSMQSAVRAGSLGAPMTLAALGGPIAARKGIVDLYRRSAPRDAKGLRVALAGHTHVGATSQSARDLFYPHYSNYWHHASGGRVPAMSRNQFDDAASAGMALMVGSPDEITERLLFAHEVLGIDRFLAQIDVGSLPFPEVAAVIERLGTRIAPVVRKNTQAMKIA
ncbi:LLM class flavin-dependent oxidoreductase [Bradyrhizobium jicamae]|uniref:LLM class flavin-dependent oxidoreductase n=1 Tax=Bradyrhizobium jicamae TaxID=280332 RepID=UPI001BA67AD6|nr:LLM class flavin-dependent oxidoreductase [Bradyrhizobium jicamae]MBR0754339.1 LLM class flavin-dependent oxidoreductase [Bradyrhizobium jicamae]